MNDRVLVCTVKDYLSEALCGLLEAILFNTESGWILTILQLHVLLAIIPPSRLAPVAIGPYLQFELVNETVRGSRGLNYSKGVKARKDYIGHIPLCYGQRSFRCRPLL